MVHRIPSYQRPWLLIFWQDRQFHRVDENRSRDFLGSLEQQLFSLLRQGEQRHPRSNLCERFVADSFSDHPRRAARSYVYRVNEIARDVLFHSGYVHADDNYGGARFALDKATLLGFRERRNGDSHALETHFYSAGDAQRLINNGVVPIKQNSSFFLDSILQLRNQGRFYDAGNPRSNSLREGRTGRDNGANTLTHRDARVNQTPPESSHHYFRRSKANKDLHLDGPRACAHTKIANPELDILLYFLLINLFNAARLCKNWTAFD